jgi:hypothetical protein
MGIWLYITVKPGVVGVIIIYSVVEPFLSNIQNRGSAILRGIRNIFWRE